MIQHPYRKILVHHKKAHLPEAINQQSVADSFARDSYTLKHTLWIFFHIKVMVKYEKQKKTWQGVITVNVTKQKILNEFH